jgi:outer membrane immunogenic protein
MAVARLAPYNFGGLGSTSFDTSGGLAGGTIGGGLSTCQTKNEWLATARGRLGYAFDRVLPYVTGGAAFGDLKVGVPALTIDTANTGWPVGGGVKYAPNRTAKIECLYVNLGNVDCDLACANVVPTRVDFTTKVVAEA